MVIRSYTCLNRNCRNEFDSSEDHPPCPRCRGLRVQWLPRPVNINSRGRAAAIDKTVRELVEAHGMTDFRSPQRGESVMKRPTPPPSGEAHAFEPQPGWRINMPDSAMQGRGHAVCATTGVTAKVAVPFDRAVPASKTLGAASRIEGSYRPKGGIPT